MDLILASAGSVIDWLLGGDPSIRYQTLRDLRDDDDPALRARIARSGWAAQLLAARNADGTWGRGFYQPKWTSSHYTLLDLRNLCVVPDNAAIRDSIHRIALREKGKDGGVAAARTVSGSDVCVNGMFLNYACYFGEPEEHLRSVVDFILDQLMPDGGFNCQKNRSGARHSSMHSTLSVLEGILEYGRNDYRYRLAELNRAAASSREFLLIHRLFRSDHTGEVIRPDFLRLPYPPRWHYNILRALDHFRAADVPWDDRLSEALDVIASKRRADGRWPVNSPYPGDVHVEMEAAGGPSRWNTLIALRVLRRFLPD